MLILIQRDLGILKLQKFPYTSNNTTSQKIYQGMKFSDKNMLKLSNIPSFLALIKIAEISTW